MESRISILTLGVDDLAASRQFYERLGWRIATEQASENIVAFNLNSFAFVLYPKHKLAEDIGRSIENAGAHPSFTMAYNVASEQDVNGVIQQARDAGARIVKEPQKAFWGGYSGYFSDPDGYLWEVAYNPCSVPSENGDFQWV